MPTEEIWAIVQTGLPRTALAGKVIVVTGSGRGIGRETALACAWLGAHVVIAEMADKGAATAREILETGGKALFVQTDVSNEASVTALVAKTHQAFGPVDVLVNNASVCPVASVIETDPLLFDRVTEVNLRGPFLTCRAFLPDMLARGHGTIVNLVATDDALPGLAAFSASKQGLISLTRVLAAEVGPQGVKVIGLAPGMVDTPTMRSIAPALARRLGMTLEEFLKSLSHPAYAGWMPADHAGAAAAYLIARLADEYHGEVVSSYTLLERAGIVRQASPAS